MRTLRARLVLSHVLPILIIIPIIGVVLSYVLETQVLLATLSDELTSQARLVAELIREQTDIWRDPAQAQALVIRLDPALTTRVMLLDHEGRLLASSDPEDQARRGQVIEVPGMDLVQSGQTSVRTQYSPGLGGEVVDVLVPVAGADEQLGGVVRLTHQVGSVYERFVRLRYLIIGFLGLEAVLAGVAGWVLALSLSRPLSRLTKSLYELRAEEVLPQLPEQGPEEVRLLVRAFNRLGQRLQTMEEARRRLLANLVHELGRPLGALVSAIQALLDGACDDAALRQELLNGMKGEVGRLQRLLDDLTQLHSRPMGPLELDCRPTALSEWLALLLPTWREAAQKKGLEWKDAVPADLPTLEIDRDRLAQALGNLFSNAVKYTSPGGTVSVAAGRSDREVWIRVSDTGPGIAAEELERIFEPFYRSQGSRRFPQGLGLGLTIARDFVVAHGGRLEVESTPGLGSHFTVRLPLPALDEG